MRNIFQDGMIQDVIDYEFSDTFSPVFRIDYYIKYKRFINPV